MAWEKKRRRQCRRKRKKEEEGLNWNGANEHRPFNLQHRAEDLKHLEEEPTELPSKYLEAPLKASSGRNSNDSPSLSTSCLPNPKDSQEIAQTICNNQTPSAFHHKKITQSCHLIQTQKQPSVWTWSTYYPKHSWHHIFLRWKTLRTIRQILMKSHL